MWLCQWFTIHNFAGSKCQKEISFQAMDLICLCQIFFFFYYAQATCVHWNRRSRKALTGANIPNKAIQTHRSPVALILKKTFSQWRGIIQYFGSSSSNGIQHVYHYGRRMATWAGIPATWAGIPATWAGIPATWAGTPSPVLDALSKLCTVPISKLCSVQNWSVIAHKPWTKKFHPALPPYVQLSCSYHTVRYIDRQ